MLQIVIKRYFRPGGPLHTAVRVLTLDDEEMSLDLQHVTGLPEIGSTRSRIACS